MTKTHSGRSEASSRKRKKATPKEQVSATDEGNPFRTWTVALLEPDFRKTGKLRGYYAPRTGRGSDRGSANPRKVLAVAGSEESSSSDFRGVYVYVPSMKEQTT